MQPIASRTLTLRQADHDVAVAINIFAPERRDQDAWSCRYEIGWPEGTRSFAGWGADAVQALVLTLGMIGAEIYSSGYHKAGLLYWNEPGGGYGFPVPPTIRDLLVGEDAKYF
jgi:hypothetical protein